MKVKHIYIILCILGTVLPYSQFLPWLLENGLNIPLLFNEIATSSIAAFGWLDVIVSAVVLFVFMWEDGRYQNTANLWLPIVGTLTVGVSLGLPLYLLLREMQRG